MTPRKRTIQILSWNVNGIRAAERKGILKWLDETSPDILCLQETKANVDQLSDALLHPKGYYTHWCSAERKGYSGVATFSKTKPSSVKQGLGVDVFDQEGRVLMTAFDEFTVINIYFPNGKKDDIRLQYKLDFYDATLEVMDRLKKRGVRLVVTGDYNTAHHPIDLDRPKENEDVSGFLPVERKWLDRLESHGYVDTLRVFRKEPKIYTWWDMKSRARDRNVGWRIDYHFVSDNLIPHLKDAFVMPEVMGSDHCPVGIKLAF